MVDQKASSRIGVPQILLAIGFFTMVLSAMVGTLAQGSAAPRYVAIVAVLFIAAGAVGVLVKKLAG